MFDHNLNIGIQFLLVHKIKNLIFFFQYVNYARIVLFSKSNVKSLDKKTRNTTFDASLLSQITSS